MTVGRAANAHIVRPGAPGEQVQQPSQPVKELRPARSSADHGLDASAAQYCNDSPRLAWADSHRLVSIPCPSLSAWNGADVNQEALVGVFASGSNVDLGRAA